MRICSCLCFITRSYDRIDLADVVVQVPPQIRDAVWTDNWEFKQQSFVFDGDFCNSVYSLLSHGQPDEAKYKLASLFCLNVVLHSSSSQESWVGLLKGMISTCTLHSVLLNLLTKPALEGFLFTCHVAEVRLHFLSIMATLFPLLDPDQVAGILDTLNEMMNDARYYWRSFTQYFELIAQIVRLGYRQYLLDTNFFHKILDFYLWEYSPGRSERCTIGDRFHSVDYNPIVSLISLVLSGVDVDESYSQYESEMFIEKDLVLSSQDQLLLFCYFDESLAILIKLFQDQLETEVINGLIKILVLHNGDLAREVFACLLQELMEASQQQETKIVDVLIYILNMQDEYSQDRAKSVIDITAKLAKQQSEYLKLLYILSENVPSFLPVLVFNIRLVSMFVFKASSSHFVVLIEKLIIKPYNNEKSAVLLQMINAIFAELLSYLPQMVDKQHSFTDYFNLATQLVVDEVVQMEITNWIEPLSVMLSTHSDQVTLLLLYCINEYTIESILLNSTFHAYLSSVSSSTSLVFVELVIKCAQISREFMNVMIKSDLLDVVEHSIWSASDTGGEYETRMWFLFNICLSDSDFRRRAFDAFQANDNLAEPVLIRFVHLY